MPDLRIPHRIALSLLSLILVGARAAAAPASIEDPAGATLATPLAASSAACTWSDGTLSNVSYQVQAPDYLTSFATRLPSGACPTCGAGQPLEIQSVSFRVRWLAACSAQATVSVVGSTSGPGCTVPDPSVVLAGPVTVPITSASAVGVVYTVPLPAGNCVSGDAFVVVRFTGFDACSQAITGTTTPCVDCQQYYTTGANPQFSDWCPYVGTGSPMWLSVDANCCVVTPTQGRSWGGVKIRYR